jgi:hypothetical protein
MIHVGIKQSVQQNGGMNDENAMHESIESDVHGRRPFLMISSTYAKKVDALFSFLCYFKRLAVLLRQNAIRIRER